MIIVTFKKDKTGEPAVNEAIYNKTISFQVI